jgi:hypothetical protein
MPAKAKYRPNAMKRTKQKGEHGRLLKMLKVLPKDYSDYGGTVERWSDPNQTYPDCSCGCRYAKWLEDEKLSADWLVCTNPRSHRCGLLTFEHQGCQQFKQSAEQPSEVRLRNRRSVL